MLFRLTMGLIFHLAAWLLNRLNKPREPTSPAWSAPPQTPPTPPPAEAQKHADLTVQLPVSSPAPKPLPEEREVTVEDVLNLQDRRIYATDSSGMIKVHPGAQRFENMIAELAYHAAHQQGPLFHEPLSFDTSTPSKPVEIAPLADVSPFSPGPSTPIPAEDGALWIAQPGGFKLAPDMPVMFPVKPEPAPAPMKLLFVPIPPEDGELYLMRSGELSRLNSPEAARPTPPV